MIQLTDSAAEVIKKKFNEKGLSDKAAIRFRVQGGGCSGFSYQTKLEAARRFELPMAGDGKYVINGIRVLIDQKSLLFLKGMTVDWTSDDFSGQFVFENPNSKGTCGCGTSFTPYSD